MSTKIQTLFHHIGDEIKDFFKKLFTGDAEQITENIIKAITVLKSLVESPVAIKAADFLPNGIGGIVLGTIDHFILDTLLTLEIAIGGEAAIANITDPTEKVSVLLRYILDNINKLPQDMQGKHWEDIARKIMEKVLNITTTEAKLLLHFKLGQMEAAASK